MLRLHILTAAVAAYINDPGSVTTKSVPSCLTPQISTMQCVGACCHNLLCWAGAVDVHVLYELL